jgi:hypothetical protein
VIHIDFCIAVICNPTATDIANAFGTVASVIDNCSTGLTCYRDYWFRNRVRLFSFCNENMDNNRCMWQYGYASQTVTFTRDIQAPVIALGSSTSIVCNPLQTQINAAFGAATVTDNCFNRINCYRN